MLLHLWDPYWLYQFRPVSWICGASNVTAPSCKTGRWLVPRYTSPLSGHLEWGTAERARGWLCPAYFYNFSAKNVSWEQMKQSNPNSKDTTYQVNLEDLEKKLPAKLRSFTKSSPNTQIIIPVWGSQSWGSQSPGLFYWNDLEKNLSGCTLFSIPASPSAGSSAALRWCWDLYWTRALCCVSYTCIYYIILHRCMIQYVPASWFLHVQSVSRCKHILSILFNTLWASISWNLLRPWKPQQNQSSISLTPKGLRRCGLQGTFKVEQITRNTTE